jgi:hypothetical protein
MAKATPQQIFEELLYRYEGEIGDALLAAFSNLRDSADVERLYAALEAADAEGVLTALHIDPAAFSVLIQAERNTFTAGGLSAASQLPPLSDRNGQSQVVRFDVAKPAIESWISTATTQTVGRIVEDQLVAIRALIHDGLARAVDPRSLALEIVGPINKVTGLREGGTIGLSAVQEQYVRTARAELQGADTAALRNYLTRTLRDARYDTAVRTAIETGKPIPAKLIDRAVQSYQNRLILQRDELLAPLRR